MDAKARDAALLEFLRQPGERHQPLWPELLTVPFVPTRGGGLGRASELFSPENQQLLDLLDRDSSFPSEHFIQNQQVPEHCVLDDDFIFRSNCNPLSNLQIPDIDSLSNHPYMHTTVPRKQHASPPVLELK